MAAQRNAGVWPLWALGVGTVISGHFAGWNLGFGVGGWGGLVIAGILIAIMYLGLVFCIAEMSPALPHTGAVYPFARAAMGPWGGFIAGVCENIQYVVTPAVVVFFIGSYLTGIFKTGPNLQPIWWIVGYVIFVGLNITGVALSFGFTLIATVLALTVLFLFWAGAIPNSDFSRWALNIASDGSELPNGNGPLLPYGTGSALAALPYAVWLFLGIERLPLAARQSAELERHMPKSIVFSMLTLIVSAFMILWLNSSVIGVGAHKLASSGEPLLDGFRGIFGETEAKILAFAAIISLIAGFHTIIFAQGRQIYSLSRAGYFPAGLSITHPIWKTPYVAMIAGAIAGLSLMMSIYWVRGMDNSAAAIGGTLLNITVAGAMLTYIAIAASFMLLRIKARPERPGAGPLGNAGAIATIVIATVTLLHQILDPVYRAGVIGVVIWFGIAIIYFALVGRHRPILSPEEELALIHKAKS